MPALHYEVRGSDLYVAWRDARAALGHDHSGVPEDDAALKAALRNAGAPEWVEGASGYTDELGWYLEKPATAADYETWRSQK